MKNKVRINLTLKRLVSTKMLYVLKQTYTLYIVGIPPSRSLSPPPLLKDLPKIESLRGVRNFLLERVDKPEKGGLM